MRGLWIVACIVGALGTTIIASFMAAEIYLARNDPAVFDGLMRQWSSMILTLVAVAIAGVCGLFLKPRQIDELTSWEPAERAAWLDVLRKDDDKSGA